MIFLALPAVSRKGFFYSFLDLPAIFSQLRLLIPRTVFGEEFFSCPVVLWVFFLRRSCFIWSCNSLFYHCYCIFIGTGF
ncbi:MAG TPA: hypothetical protein DEQ20_03465 [Desulfobulbaceae bacterium]|nr:MAG: hypothetical protein A2520_10940 [Deltaproteobacteria bacterium RIFOXYD12_FULL_53_23]HCC53970.1 hypothetical protein [Desulfobulbaceae bacterium]